MLNAEERKKLFLKEYARLGACVAKASRSAGVTRATVYNWRKADEEFARQMHDLEIQTNENVRNALYEAALRGNVGAQIFWLINRCPDEWKQRYQVDGKIMVDRFAKMSDEELMKFLAENGIDLPKN